MNLSSLAFSSRCLLSATSSLQRSALNWPLNSPLLIETIHHVCSFLRQLRRQAAVAAPLADAHRRVVHQRCWLQKTGFEVRSSSCLPPYQLTIELCCDGMDATEKREAVSIEDLMTRHFCCRFSSPVARSRRPTNSATSTYIPRDLTASQGR